jgi:polysaccharide biosynthesis/export protein
MGKRMRPQSEPQSVLNPKRTGNSARWLAALLGAALMTLAIEGRPAAVDTLGIGDTIRITVFQNPDLTTEARISEQGTIVFPLIGEVAVGGHTPTSARTLIATQLKRGNFIKDPQVHVLVTQIRSRQVSVLGNVARPGRYVLDDSKSTLTDILALAGGIAPDGADTVTVVAKRNGAEKTVEVNIPEMVRKGDMSANFEVRSGDTIYVQRAPVFYIYGEVQRAGAYRVEPQMLVMHALSLGGGLTPRGSERGLAIHRRMPDGAVRKIDAKLFEAVRPDDVIYVKESLF